MRRHGLSLPLVAFGLGLALDLRVEVALRQERTGDGEEDVHDLLVVRGEHASPADLVDELQHPDDLVVGLERHAEDGASAVAGLLVDRLVEVRIVVRVRDVQSLSGGGDYSCDALVHRDLDVYLSVCGGVRD
ncbi:MAG: hypothetical protein RIS22_1073 [Actinomycetota bacterium]